MGGYAAAGWLLLQAADQLIGRGLLPEVTYRLTLLLLIVGVPGVLVVTWFHGARGTQRMPATEVWILSVLALVAVASGGAMIQDSLQSEAAASQLFPSPTDDPRRVAVLYFDDASPDGALGHLADGLTEALIQRLSEVDALEVTSRNGVHAFRGRRVPTDSIARILQVGSLVDGSVSGSPDSLRVRVHLVEASSGKQVAGTTIAWERTDIFALQDLLADEVATFLRQRVGDEVELARSRRGTPSSAAWELQQRARVLEEDADRVLREGDVSAAQRLLERADSLLALASRTDPDWAEPLTTRGWIAYRRARLAEGFDRSHYDRWLGRASLFADSTLAAAPEDPDARELRGTVRYFRFLLNLDPDPLRSRQLFEGAEEDLRASVAVNPDQASAWSSLSHLLMNKAETAEAKIAALRSYEADPWLSNVHLTLWRLFSTSLDLGDGVEAKHWCAVGSVRFPEDPRFVQCRVFLYALEDATPDIDEAWRLADRYVELSPPNLYEFRRREADLLVSYALVRAGMPDSARSVAKRSRLGPEGDPTRELLYLEAITHTLLGDEDEALSLLSQFLATNPGQRESIARDRTWWFEPLRDHPRYQVMVGHPRAVTRR